MAAPEDQIIGVNVILSADSNVIGGQTDATLQRNANAIDIQTKTAGFFGKSLNGPGEWSLSLDNAMTESDGSHVVGANNNAKLDITYDPGSGSVTETVKDLQTLTMDLSAETAETSGLEDPLWNVYRVVSQALTIDLSGAYLDPQSTVGAAYGLLLDAQDANETVDYEFTFGGLVFTGTVTPGDWTLSAPSAGDNATFEMSLRHEGTQSAPTGTIDSGLDALISKFFNRNTLAALVEYQENSTAVTGATSYTGDTLVTSLTLEASRSEVLSFNAELQGTDALSRTTQ